jgi:hypothetical protein
MIGAIAASTAQPFHRDLSADTIDRLRALLPEELLAAMDEFETIYGSAAPT